MTITENENVTELIDDEDLFMFFMPNDPSDHSEAELEHEYDNCTHRCCYDNKNVPVILQ